MGTLDGIKVLDLTTMVSGPVAAMMLADQGAEVVADEISKGHRDEILARLDANDVPCAPLLTRMELMDHEQIRSNGSIDRPPGQASVRCARPFRPRTSAFHPAASNARRRASTLLKIAQTHPHILEAFRAVV